VQWLDQQGQVAATMGIKGDAAGNLALPKGVAMDDDGNIWVVDAQFENIQAFSTDGRLLMAFGGEGRGPGEFWLPAGACIDELQRLWVADTHNHRVQVFQLLP
jgi:sugar lactone lactonase YvrE